MKIMRIILRRKTAGKAIVTSRPVEEVSLGEVFSVGDAVVVVASVSVE